MSKIGIIGWGVVGQAVGQGFANPPRREAGKHSVFWYDKYKKGPWSIAEVVESSEIIFICVPTPMYDDLRGTDLSIVDAVVGNLAGLAYGTDKIVVIKSTVLPGTTARLAKKYPRLNLAMNPEFLTEANAPWDFMHPDRTIIGAFLEPVQARLATLYRTILPARSKMFLTDPTTAELVKYAANVMLSARVIIANEIYAVAQALGVSYDNVKDMVAADPRIGQHHLKVPGPDGDFGFGGKCFPKDMVAFLHLGKRLGVDLTALRAIWKKNLAIRKNRNWEEIPGAMNSRKTNSKHEILISKQYLNSNVPNSKYLKN